MSGASGLTVSGEERDSGAFGTRTPGTTNAMNIVFGIVRVVVVEDVGDVLDVFLEVSISSTSIMI